ncbi:MAG: molybdopterin adenylyltransferase [Bradymonadaceae bacterium]
MDTLTVGIITCSDRAHAGEYEDESGPALEAWLDEAIVSDWESHRTIVPDEQDQIAGALREYCDEVGCDLVLTTGGTGPAPRDVTPEATMEVADKVMEGFGERMRQISLQYVPTAILSRQKGVTRGRSLIVNLPGNPKAIGEILDELWEVIPYTVELLEGPSIETDQSVVETFRPKHA